MEDGSKMCKHLTKGPSLLQQNINKMCGNVLLFALEKIIMIENTVQILFFLLSFLYDYASFTLLFYYFHDLKP